MDRGEEFNGDYKGRGKLLDFASKTRDAPEILKFDRVFKAALTGVQRGKPYKMDVFVFEVPIQLFHFFVTFEIEACVSVL